MSRPRRNELLCKLLCHNNCCVIQSRIELGIEAIVWPEEAKDESATGPEILPMVRPG